jgi:hypothetical protein
VKAPQCREDGRYQWQECISEKAVTFQKQEAENTVGTRIVSFITILSSELKWSHKNHLISTRT